MSVGSLPPHHLKSYLLPHPSCTLCPRYWISQALWLYPFGRPPWSLSFPFFRKSTLLPKPLSHSCRLKYVLRILPHLNQGFCLRSSSLYSGLSFRRGGASFAFSCGIPSDLIKIQGDWSLDAYLRYLSSSLDHRRKLTQTISHHILHLPL